MSEHFIVAENLRQADATARIDWGWSRIAQDVWRNLEGRSVCYVGSADRFRGLRDVVVYLGYGWRNNRELHGLEAMASTGRVELRKTGARRSDP